MALNNYIEDKIGESFDEDTKDEDIEKTVEDTVDDAIYKSVGDNLKYGDIFETLDTVDRWDVWNLEECSLFLTSTPKKRENTFA